MVLRRKRVIRPFGLLLVALMVLGMVFPAPKVSAAAVDLSGAAVAFIYDAFMKDGPGAEDNAVGPYALYVCSQAGIDVSFWVYGDKPLGVAVAEIIYQDATNPGEVSAKQLAKDILAAQELGESGLVQQLLGALRERHGKSGFDANIFSDMPAYDLLGRAGRLGDVLDTVEAVEAKVYARDYVLAAQDGTCGAFGSVWEGTFYPDFMTTAQAVRALHYLNCLLDRNEQVRAAIDAGLNWMRAQQREDGSFAASDWDDPLIDTVEVIATLDVLNIEPASWAHESTEKIPVDYMMEGALNEGGSFGSCKNVMDAVWALYGYHLLGSQLQIVPPSMVLAEGKGGQFTLAFLDSEGVVHDVTAEASWSMGDSSVASVDGGYVTALSAGQTTVTAVYGGLTATAVVKVEAAGGSGGGGAAPSTCTVGVAVVGPGGELLYGPSYVTVSERNQWGLTALGALDATGVSYKMSTKWEGFVESICGIANEGMSGWMYTVNGSISMVPAGEYEISDGDKVIWYYSESMNQEPPKWEDLISHGSSGTSSGTTESPQNALKNLLAEFDEGKVAVNDAVTTLADIVEGLDESKLTEEVREQLAEVIQKTAQLLEKLPDEAFNVQSEEDHVRVAVDEELFQAQIEAIKKVAEVAEKVADLEVSDVEGLVKDTVVVELPAAAAEKKAVSVELSAGAARQLAQSALNLLIRSAELELTLPPEAVDSVLEATEGVSWIEITTQRMELEEVNTFEGADAVGGKVVDITVTAVTPEGEKSKPKASFPKKVVVTIPLEGVDISQVNVNRIAAYRQKENGEWEYVGGSLSAHGKFFTFETDHLSVYALMEYKKSFPDISGHWAQDVIESMAMRLIVSGMGDGTFAPDQSVTRAQFAALLVKALGIEGRIPLMPTFNDVAPEYWGYPAIEAASHAGLVLGTGKGRFEPKRNITREEMAAMIVRALEKSGIDVSVTVEEVQEALAGYEDAGAISGWAKECLAICVDQGIIKGRTPMTIAPQGMATRAEAVVVSAKMLQCLGEM